MTLKIETFWKSENIMSTEMFRNLFNIFCITILLLKLLFTYHYHIVIIVVAIYSKKGDFFKF